MNVSYDGDGNPRTTSWRDAFAEREERRKDVLLGRVQWGSWRYNPETLCLEFPTRSDAYHIALTECTTSAEVLDWIIQIAEKSWADDATLAGLVHAIDELLHPQATICSMGIERGPMDVKSLLTPPTLTSGTE